MHKVIKIIFITFLSIIGIAFLISAYYLATYELPAPVDTRAIAKEKALNYLKERYGEDFEIVNFIDPEPYHNFYNITALRIGDPNDIEHEVTLHGWVTKGEKKLFKKGKDKITFYDNYAAIKVIPELKEKISELVLEDYPECKIHISFHKEWIQNNVDLYSSAKEFLEKDTYWKHSMSIAIFTLDEKIDEKRRLKKYSKKIFKQLVEENFLGNASIHFYKDNNNYDKINTSLIHQNPRDLSYMSEICGEDLVYSRCNLRKAEDLKFDFRDK